MRAVYRWLITPLSLTLSLPCDPLGDQTIIQIFRFIQFDMIFGIVNPF